MKVIMTMVAISVFATAVAGSHFVSFGDKDRSEFLVDGKAVQIRAGELEPQRVPREYWRHRVRMCKAMGLNAISSYFAWNDFEQPDGSFDFKTSNCDVAAFLSLCKEEGMWVLFRPGPYICGENTIDIMELELSQAQPIRGLAHPLYLDSGISTKNAANEW